jgi:hypothetical protein
MARWQNGKLAKWQVDKMNKQPKMVLFSKWQQQPIFIKIIPFNCIFDF